MQRYNNQPTSYTAGNALNIAIKQRALTSHNSTHENSFIYYEVEVNEKYLNNSAKHQHL
jgi:hypothetical protein